MIILDYKILDIKIFQIIRSKNDIQRTVEEEWNDTGAVGEKAESNTIDHKPMVQWCNSTSAQDMEQSCQST